MLHKQIVEQVVDGQVDPHPQQAQGQGLPATHFVPVTMLITAGLFG